MVDPSIDAEAAAFVYLMAETEAIFEHDQKDWVDHSCGTSACLAGHAFAYSEGDDKLEELTCSTNIPGVAIDTLLDRDTASSPEKADLMEVFYLCQRTSDMNASFSMDRPPLSYDSVEERALDAFKKWVETWGSEETVETFHRLINLDVEKFQKEIA
jgi:hypothetical protein